MNGGVDRDRDGWMDAWMDGWRDGGVDGHMDGGMDGGVDGGMNGGEGRRGKGIPKGRGATYKHFLLQFSLIHTSRPRYMVTAHLCCKLGLS